MSPLTPDEIRFFTREGYLIKREVLDPELMARARERKWAGAPARMKRDDPGTWFGPFRPDEELVEERDKTLGERIVRNWELYLFILPAFGLIVLFHYVPIYGLQLAFKRFLAVKGIWAARGPGCRTSASSSTAPRSS